MFPGVLSKSLCYHAARLNVLGWLGLAYVGKFCLKCSCEVL